MPVMLVGCFFGCASPPPLSEEPASSTLVREGYAVEFTEGQFVGDVRSLKDPDSTDLRELAMTLPILESPEALDWYYENSAPAITEDQWRLPADGAQGGVLVERLPSATNGAQRLRLTVNPIPLGVPPKGFQYVSELERREGGWLVLEAEKTRTL